MASKNPFEGFINEELADKIDDFTGEASSFEKTQPAQQSTGKIAVAVEYIRDQEINQIVSLMYETKYSQKVNHLKPKGRNAGNNNFQINGPLDQFVSDYSSELDFRGVRHEKEDIMLGTTPSEGILHKIIYHEPSHEPEDRKKIAEEIRGIIKFLVDKYN